MSTEVQSPEREQAREFTVAPAVSIFEEPQQWLIQADMPGVTKENAKLNTEDNYLTITGKRTRGESAGRRLYRESRDVSYRRTFELPSTVDISRVSARLENGVLSITLPKAEKVLPRTIEVGD